MQDDSLQLVHDIAQLIYDKKGQNILALDVRGLSSITDFMLFAEGNVDRHVKAIQSTIKEELKSRDLQPLYVEGTDTCEWIVMDYADVIIHLFVPGLREKYGLEKVWSEGNLIDLNLNVSNAQAR